MDSLFGNFGIYFPDTLNLNVGRKIHALNNGKFIVESNSGLVRFDENGALETTFQMAIGLNGNWGRTIQILENGSIVLLRLVNNVWTLFRLLENGTIDQNYGTNGLYEFENLPPLANLIYNEGDTSFLFVNHSLVDKGILQFFKFKKNSLSSLVESIFPQNNRFSIYPNPTDCNFTMSKKDLTPISIQEIKLIDESGRIVFQFLDSKDGNNNFTEGEFQLPNNLINGLYFIKINSFNYDQLIPIEKVSKK